MEEKKYLPSISLLTTDDKYASNSLQKEVMRDVIFGK